MLYSLAEVMAMLRVLPDPARTTVSVAAFSGLRRCEIRGLLWEHYSGDELKVARSVWESFVNETKNRKSKASVPVIEPPSASARLSAFAICGNPARGVMFATMKETPLSLNNVLNRQILSVLKACLHCGKLEDDHGNEAHGYERNPDRPQWQGWHAFRRGLATNLHDLGVPDKTIQAILRRANVSVRYVKSLDAQSISAMQQLEKLVDPKLLSVGAVVV